MHHVSRYNSTAQFLVVGVNNTSEVRPTFVTPHSPPLVFPFASDVTKQFAWANAVIEAREMLENAFHLGDRLLYPQPIEIALGSERQRGTHWHVDITCASQSVDSSSTPFPGLCSVGEFNYKNIRQCYFVTFVLLSYSQTTISLPREIIQQVLGLCACVMEDFSMRSLLVYMAEKFMTYKMTWEQYNQFY
jgi:hypothetical protein